MQEVATSHRTGTTREFFHLIVAVACGAAAFFVVVGPVPLRFSNVAWMHGGDLSQYYLAWSFFRQADWQATPSLNPTFGIEIATTIFFADLIPLIALPAKLLAPSMGPWQYHGWWLFVCFIMQACLASRICSVFSDNPWHRALLAILACFAPIFLLRVGMHLSLAGQWLLLAGLLLCLRRPTQAQAFWWATISSVSAMVHSYIVIMVVALWGADLARRVIVGAKFWRLAAEAVLVLGLAGAALWLAGFRLLDGGGLAQGRFFGQFQTDLIGLIDLRGWSWAAAQPRPAGAVKGFSFLGIGGLLLLGLALALSRRAPRPRLAGPYIPLAALLLALFLFSLSHRIVAAQTLLFVVPMPDRLLAIAEMVRASERFAWPIYYVVLLGAAIVVARRMPGRPGVIVLAAAVAIQVSDTSAGWLRVRETLSRPGSVWPTELGHPFWAKAGSEYRALRRLLAQSHAPGWSDLAHFALGHRMPTDIVYLARFSFGRLGALRSDGEQRVATARFDDDTLYILDDRMARLALLNVNAKRDLLARIDGHNVLAPGWRVRHGLAPGVAPLTLDDLVPALRLGEAVEVSASQSGTEVLVEGWSTPEAWGVWSDGDAAALAIRIEHADEAAVTLRLEGRALVTAEHPSQRFVVWWDARQARASHFSASSARVVIDIPLEPLSEEEAGGQRRPHLLRIAFPDAVAPSALGLNQDERRVAFGLERLRLMPSPRE
jgi:hypothetical protein